MAQVALDLNALSAAICKGVVEGNVALVSELSKQAEKRHDLRDAVQANADKVWEIDGELKLLKGVMVTLVGSGDGSSGMVPRLEKDLKSLGDDMSSVKSDMREVQGHVSGIRDDVKTILESQSTQRSFVDGWKGVAVALGIVGTCFTIIGGIITGLVWLFQHGAK